MRLGQTSAIVFLSKFAASILGFLATLYFARFLGAEILGYYAVVMAVVSWLKFGGSAGVTEAVVKRISGGTAAGAYLTAGALTMGSLALVLSIVVVILRDIIDSYVGVESWYFVLLLLLSGLLVTFTQSILKGERKVHLSGILTPINLVISSLTQIGLVLFGFGLTGMLGGYLLGELLVGLLGFAFVSVSPKVPAKEHFQELFEFAKYSWLGGLETRSFNDVDILLLGVFVPSSLVGIYSVAWSISKFLSLFGNAVRGTMFPEISNADTSENDERISQLTETSLAYVGLIAIPGLFGGFLLADRLLRIYGEEFTQGANILVLLIMATLIYSYQQQMMGIIKGIDRAEIAFWINFVFIAMNVVLNISLILWVGWVGAAIATVISSTIGLVLAFWALRRLVNFSVPIGELGRQIGAAGVMAAIVYGLRTVIEGAELLQYNILVVVILVAVGAGVYFLTLFGISSRFRQTIVANLPIQIPFMA